MKKEAGVLGGAMLGVLPGMAIGGTVGSAIGKAIYRKPTQEVLNEMSNYEKAKKSKQTVLDSYSKKSNPQGIKSFQDLDGAEGLYSSIISELDSEKHNGLTVGQVEDLASQRVHDFSKSISKTASIKSTLIGAGLGAGVAGIGLGRVTYKQEKDNKTNPDVWKSKIKYENQEAEELKNLLDQNVEHRPFFEERDHNKSYSPSLLMSHKDFYDNNFNDMGCAGDSAFGSVVNDALKKQNINYRNLSWGQYKKLIKENYDNIMNGESLDLSSIKNNKQASQIVNKAFEKQAGDIAMAGGAILGAALPVVGGAMLGNKMGKKKYNPEPLKAENSALESKVQSLKKEIGDSSPKKISIDSVIRNRLNSDDYLNLSVGEAANKLYGELGLTEDDINESLGPYGYDHDFLGINKKASFKSAIKDFGIGAGAFALGLGPIIGPLGFASAFTKNKQDKENAERSIKDNQKELARLTELSKFKDGPDVFLKNAPKDDKIYALSDYQGDFGGIKSALVDPKFSDHGFNYDVQIIDRKLKDMGYDVNNMNFKQYRDIVDDVYENALWKDDDWGDDTLDDFMEKYKKADQIVNESFEKMAKSRDEETRTRLVRDTVVPELKRSPYSIAGTMAGGAISGKIMGDAGTRLIEEMASKGKINGKHVGKLAGGLAAGLAVNKGINAIGRTKDLNKLHERYGLGKPTGADHRANLGITPGLFSSVSDASVGERILHPIKNSLATPEAIVQAKRRKVEKMSKDADEVVEEAFDKIATVKRMGAILKGQNVKAAKSALSNAENTLSIAREASKKALTSGNPFAKAGLGNLYVDGAREDVMKAFSNLGKEKTKTLAARVGVGAGVGALTAGTAYAAKKKKDK